MKARLILVVSSLMWLSAVVAGSRTMLLYETTPGAAAAAPVAWPSATRVPRASGSDTLLLFAHPRCPCSRATIEELNELMAECQGKVQVRVLFYKPQGTADAWAHTDLWDSAAAIPGVQVLVDEGGREARRFHAETSGAAVLFDSVGHLLFSGGITGARGHVGENAGHDAIVALVTVGKADCHSTLVYGCSLRDPSAVRSDSIPPELKSWPQ